jgi:polyphosphate kinase
VHPEVIDALYRASEAGVDVDLIVRGICCLRPGLPGMSERIRVRSVLGRFLEHSRIWRFANGGRPEYYIGSADWMPRNLERRVEVVAPVEDPALHPRLDRLLQMYLEDNRQAWLLHADGTYVQVRPGEGERPRGVHDQLLRDAWGQARASGAVRVVRDDQASDATAEAAGD